MDFTLNKRKCHWKDLNRNLTLCNLNSEGSLNTDFGENRLVGGGSSRRRPGLGTLCRDGGKGSDSGFVSIVESIAFTCGFFDYWILVSNAGSESPT